MRLPHQGYTTAARLPEPFPPVCQTPYSLRITNRNKFGVRLLHQHKHETVNRVPSDHPRPLPSLREYPKDATVDSELEISGPSIYVVICSEFVEQICDFPFCGALVSGWPNSEKLQAPKPYYSDA